MNLAHLHLLLNHWPIIGTYVGVALILVSLFWRSNDIRQVSHALFAFLALVTIPAYLSGNAAAESTKELNLAMPLIEAHEGAAMMAFISLELTGLVALIGLWRFSRTKSPVNTPSWSTAGVFVLSILTAALMAVAGTTGGDIRHPEILSGEQAPSAIAAQGAALILSMRYVVVEYSRWIWPIIEDLHFIGLILIFASVGLLNVRVLGFMKQLPVGPLHRLLPWGIAGLILNVITGVLFFIGMPFFYVGNPYFQFKIFLILLAGGNLLLFHCTGIFHKWSGLGPGDDAPLFAKIVAASSLVLWILVVIIGRYIPVGEVT